MLGVCDRLRRLPSEGCGLIKVDADTHAVALAGRAITVGELDSAALQLTLYFVEGGAERNAVVSLEALYRSLGNPACFCKLCLGDPEQISSCSDLSARDFHFLLDFV